MATNRKQRVDAVDTNQPAPAPAPEAKPELLLTLPAVVQRYRETFVKQSSKLPSSHSAEFRDFLMRDLTQQRDEVISALLGLDRTWSTPELKDKGLLNPEIQALCRESVRDWVVSEVQDYLKDERAKFKAQMVTALKKKVKDRIEWEMRDYVTEIAKQLGDEACRELKKEIGLLVRDK